MRLIIVLLVLSFTGFAQTMILKHKSSSTVATPTDSPGAGVYGTPQTVTLSDSTSGATICYTVDGSTPAATTPGTCSAGATYSSGFSVSHTATVKAIGTKTAFTNSGLLTSLYTVGRQFMIPGVGGFNSSAGQILVPGSVEVDQ